MVYYNVAEPIEPLPINIYLFLNNVFALLIISLYVGPTAIALESETSKVTVFRQLSAAKGIAGLPVKFEEFLVDGQREAFSEILFESGMKKADVEDYLKYLSPKPGKAQTVISHIGGYIPRDRADPLYYDHINKIPMRFLIMPTHIMLLVRDYEGGSVIEVAVPLAIDHRGIAIIGYKEYENYKVDKVPSDVKDDTFPWSGRGEK